MLLFRRSWLLMLALACLGFFYCKKDDNGDTGGGLPALSPHPRGVWLTNVGSEVLYSKAGIEEAVDRCRRSGVNLICVVMWNKGRTLYQSDIMGQTFGIPIEERLAGRDPLRELLDAAHKQGIKVYAWFEYGFAADNAGRGEHILRLRPQWAALGSDGRVVNKNGFRWMNAFDPAVQDFMLSLLKEIVNKYPDLDGIQGDDRLPALPVEAGYNANVVAEYKAENNGEAPPSDFRQPNWVNWRAERLNKFAERLYKEMKATRPNLIVSMAPSTFPFSRNEYLQDWPTWVRNGWVDQISPQLYRYNITDYKAELARAVSYVPNDQRNKLVPGVLLKVSAFTPTTELLQQIVDENRRLNVNGEIFFYYEGIPEQEAFFKNYAKN